MADMSSTSEHFHVTSCRTVQSLPDSERVAHGRSSARLTGCVVRTLVMSTGSLRGPECALFTASPLLFVPTLLACHIPWTSSINQDFVSMTGKRKLSLVCITNWTVYAWHLVVEFASKRFSSTRFLIPKDIALVDLCTGTACGDKFQVT